MKHLIFVAIAIITFWSCSHDTSHTHQSDDKLKNMVNDDEHETESVTLYSENFEVFAEYDLLRAGQKSEFLIHVTNLDDDYSAFIEGTIEVVLNVGGEEQKKVAESANVAGIYNLVLVPGNIGSGSITFNIQSNSTYESLIEDHLHVYEKDETNIHHHGSETTGLTKYTKEQAWKSDFNVILVKEDIFSSVITASGEFLAMPGEKQNVVSKSQGIVVFATRNLVQGKFVNKGDELFTLSGQGLADNNILVRFNKAKTNFQKSKNDLVRHQSLFNEKIISEKQYQETKSKYINDSVLYYSLVETVGTEGMKIRAPKSGYIHELNVSEGQYVEPGNLMATISTNKVILLRADVPQQYFNELGKITTTHFRPAYTSRIYTLEELSGKLIASGASVAENNHYMPVYFEVVNDGTILEGAFAEFYLKTNPEPGHIVIPMSALIEDQGNYSVYVQVSGEEFQKRVVELKTMDGIKASVASGLNIGERIVSEGPMLIKMASTSAIPTHNHAH